MECKAFLQACVDVDVCYKQLERKGNNDACRLGNNTILWCFTHHPDQGSDENPLSFCAKHNNESKYYPVHPTGCPDWECFWTGLQALCPFIVSYLTN